MTGNNHMYNIYKQIQAHLFYVQYSSYIQQKNRWYYTITIILTILTLFLKITSAVPSVCPELYS